MATNADSGTFDPFKPSKYTIDLGAAFRHPPNTSLFSSVRYNYKPQGIRHFKKVNLSKNPTNEICVEAEALTDNAIVIYDGHRRESTNAYFLTLDHDRKIATLEAAETEYIFNVESSSELKEGSEPYHQHPPIHFEEDTAEDAQQPRVELESSQVDLHSCNQPEMDNPFDYRHYIDSLPEVHPHNTPLPSPARTPQASSISVAQARELSAKKRDTIQKPTNAHSAARQKSTASVRARRALQPPKRRKPLDISTSDEEVISAAEDTTGNELQRVGPNVSARQSVAQKLIREPWKEDDKDDEEGGFVIEGDDDNSIAAFHNAATNLLGTPTHAPISLRSAANSVSPTSLAATPVRLEEKGHQHSRLAREESDEDVEELALGSPQIRHSDNDLAEGKVYAADTDAVDGPDEEDFDAVLAALEDDDDEDAQENPRTRRRSSLVQRSAAYESEESEEE